MNLSKGCIVIIVSVNLDGFSLTNHEIFIKFNKLPPPNFCSIATGSYSYIASRLICLHHYSYIIHECIQINFVTFVPFSLQV